MSSVKMKPRCFYVLIRSMKFFVILKKGRRMLPQSGAVLQAVS